MADRSLPQYDGRPLLAAREMSALAWGTKVTGLNTRGAPMCASGRKTGSRSNGSLWSAKRSFRGRLVGGLAPIFVR
jgi:hypothetical protein